MFARFFRRPKFYRRVITFEQLEERIVFDAAVAPAADQAADNADQTIDGQNPDTTNPAASADSQPEDSTSDGDQDALNVVFGQDLNVVLISNALDQIEALSDSAVEHAQVIVYDAEEDGLADIIDMLEELTESNGSQISHLAVVSHGDAGVLTLGDGEVWTISTVTAGSEQWNSLGSLLTEDARIDLYACDIGQGEAGALFVETLASATGAVVWASDDATGNVGDADWELETQSGAAGRDGLLDTESLADTSILLDGGNDATANDQPILSGDVALTAIAEDSVPAGELVSDFVAGIFSDTDGTLGGIAIVGNAADAVTEGVWQYSSDNGATWADVGTVSSDDALLIAADGLIRFLPVSDYCGDPGELTIRAVDDTWSGGFSISGVSETRVTLNVDSPFSLSTIGSILHDLSGVVTGDLDNDGDLDIYVTTQDDGPAGPVQNYLFINNGDGTFTQSDISGDDFTSPAGVMGDVNGDGWLDIYLADYCENNGLWINNGDGTFTWGKITGDTSVTSFDAVMGDVNGDGLLDIYVVNHDEWPSATDQNYLWINNADGTFTPSNITGDTEESWAAAMGDVDGNGYLDIYVANSGQNRLWLNNGDGTFTQSNISGDTGTSYGAVMGDVNGDGYLDIYVANSGQNRLWLGNGDGTFTEINLTGDVGTSHAAVMGDVNGDGYLDIYVANGGQNRLWLNNGDGTFTESDITGDTGGSSDTVMGDVNGDGRLDILVVDSGNEELRLWTNNNLGSVSSTDRTVSISVTPVNDAPDLSDVGGTLTYTEDDGAKVIDGTIALTDVDDTHLESATIRITGGYRIGEDMLSIDAAYLASGISRSWDAATGTLTLNGSATVAEYEAMLEHVTYADISNEPDTADRIVTWTVNDGDEDSAPQTSTITVLSVNDQPILSGDVALTAIAEDSVPAGELVSDFVAGIFSDTDGTLGGIAIVGNAADAVTEGVWQYSSDNGATWADVGTVSSDDALLIAADRLIRFLPVSDYCGDPGELTIRAVDDTWSGGFSISGVSETRVTLNVDSPFSLSTIGSILHDLSGVVTGDLDNDGDLDIYVTTQDDGPAGPVQNYLFINNGDGTFTQSDISGDDFTSPAGVMGDVNGDGWLDIYLADYCENNGLWINNGDGTFTWGKITGDTSVTSFDAVMGDVNGDGLLDIYVVNHDEWPSATDQNYLWINNADGTFTPSNITGDTEESWAAAMGDVDGNGYLDIYVANSGQNRLWLNNGDGTFTQSNISGDTGTSYGAVMGDVNGDGYLDIYVANSGQNRLWLGNGDGTFTEINLTGDVGTSHAAVMGDVNGDGYLDIYVANGGQNRLWLNNGDGTFTESDITGDTGGSSDTVMGDVNGDGRLDILVVDSGNEELRLWTNNNLGSVSSTDRTVSISVTPVNDAPDLSDVGGTLTYTEDDGAKVIDGTIALTDVDDTHLESATIRITGGYRIGEDMLSIDAAYLASGISRSWDAATGTLTLNGSATVAEYEAMLEHVTYADISEDPDTADRTVTWTVNDGDADSPAQTSTITVDPLNDAPTADDDAYTVNEDETLIVDATNGVLNGDDDVDGDSLSAVLVSGPSHGTLTLNSDGSFSYTADSNFSGTDSFTYSANDGTMSGAEAVVTITVDPVNDAPTADDDTYTVNEDETLLVDATNGVLNGDVDVEGDSVTAVLVSGPSHGTLTLNSDGSFTYTPYANFNGIDSFTYAANDGTMEGVAAVVTITIDPENDAPIADDDAYTVNEDETLLVDATNGVLHGDDDVDGDSLSAVLVSGPVHGTLTLNSDGSFTYTPNANFNGIDSFTYAANDGTTEGEEAVVAITVDPVNDAPAAGDIVVGGLEDQPVVVTWGPSAFSDSNDSPDDGADYVTITSLPANGALYYDSDNNGTFETQLGVNDTVAWSEALAGRVVFLGSADWNGSTSFTYTVTDNGGTEQGGVNTSANATITLTLQAVNDSPMSSGVPDPTPQNQGFGFFGYDISSFFWDVDGPALTFELGTLTYINGLILTGIDVDPVTGLVTFTNDPTSTGSVVVQVRANDGYQCCSWQAFTLTVNPPDYSQPPYQPPGDPIPDQSNPRSSIDYHPTSTSFPFSESSPLYGESYASGSAVSYPIGKGILNDDHVGNSDEHERAPLRQLESLFFEEISRHYGEDTSRAPGGMSEFVDELTRRVNPEQVLGLEEFLARLRGLRIGEDHDTIRLGFNAGEINLAEWFDSLRTFYERLNDDYHTEPVGSAGLVKPWLQAKTLVFDLDEIRMADILSSGSEDDLQAKLTVARPNPAQGITRVFDLSKMSLLDLAS